MTRCLSSSAEVLLAQLDLHMYARLGATARLEQIHREEVAIYGEFPDLRGRGRVDGTGAVSFRAPNGRAAAKSTTGPRRRRKLSAAARKRISDAQKRRWAAHRQAKGTQ